jgi:hypothetical protein
LEFSTVLSGEFGNINILFYGLEVALYPSFWLIGMMKFVPLTNDFHSAI